MQPKAVVIDYRDRKAYGLSQLISLQQQCQAFEAVLSSAKVGVLLNKSEDAKIASQLRSIIEDGRQYYYSPEGLGHCT
jgi:ABC-type uncharacterized transport system substrate-binding protein